MITVFLLTSHGWRSLAIEVCVVVLPGRAPLPRDVFAVVVDALATALAAEYRTHHPEARRRR